jgi:hypothetical protein
MKKVKYLKNKNIRAFTRSFLALNGCDYCGSTPRGYCTTLGDDYLIRCSNCGQCGPTAESVALSVYAWNAWQQDQKKTALRA